MMKKLFAKQRKSNDKNDCELTEGCGKNNLQGTSGESTTLAFALENTKRVKTLKETTAMFTVQDSQTKDPKNREIEKSETKTGNRNFEENLFDRFAHSAREPVDGIIESSDNMESIKLFQKSQQNPGKEISDEIKLSVEAKSQRRNWVWDTTDEKNSRKITFWSILNVYAVLYNFSFIITRLCFEQVNTDYLSAWISIDVTADALYFFDIVLQHRATFLYQGLSIVDIQRTMKKYFSKRVFKLDVFSAIPFDHICYILKGGFSILNLQTNHWIFSGQFLLILRFNRLFKLGTILNSFEKIEKRTNMPNAIRITRLCLCIAIIVHWNACIFFLISEKMTLGSDNWVFGGCDEPELQSMLLNSIANGESMITNDTYSSLGGPTYFESISLQLARNKSCSEVSPEMVCLEPTSDVWKNADEFPFQISFSLSCKHGLSYEFEPFLPLFSDNNSSSLPTYDRNKMDDFVWGVTNRKIKCHFSYQYLYSMYWSTLTLTTIGETPLPENDSQFIFMVGDFLLGVIIFATVIGNVGTTIKNFQANETKFKSQLDTVKQYMNFRRVDRKLERKIIHWFDYIWDNQKSIDEQALIDILPPKLRAEIALHIHVETLKRVAIFSDCEPGFLIELVLKLKPEVFSPGDFVCRKGDVGKEMYIIKQGFLDVVSEDGSKVFATLKPGSYFGEISILGIEGNVNGNRRTANIRSQGFTDLFALSKTDLMQATRDYPEAKESLIEKGKQILIRDNMYKAPMETASTSKKCEKKVTEN